MTYDAARGRVVLHISGEGTWELDGGQWIRRTPGPVRPPDGTYELAYDSARRRSVLVGTAHTGLFGTWEYGPVHAATSERFGTGCAGTAGMPDLAAVDGSLPWLGDPFQLRLSGVPAMAPAVLLLGVSRTAWGPIPLPRPLDGRGMPGCALRVDGTLVLPVPGGTGGRTVTLPVPNDPALLGAAFFNQTFQADPGANAAGITVSNGTESVIGGR